MEDLWDNLYRDERESKSKSAEDISDGTISWEVWLKEPTLLLGWFKVEHFRAGLFHGSAKQQK